jgi:hypothetical protein
MHAENGGHPFSVNAVTDDEPAFAGGNGREQSRFNGGRARAGQHDCCVVRFGFRHKGLQQFSTDAVQQFRKFGLPMAHIRTQQGATHALRNVHGTGIQ